MSAAARTLRRHRIEKLGSKSDAAKDAPRRGESDSLIAAGRVVVGGSAVGRERLDRGLDCGDGLR